MHCTFHNVCLVKTVTLCLEANVKIENATKLCTASSILLLNCIANQVRCLPYINHTVLTREIEKNRIASSEMVEHLCFKSVKQSFFYFLSCAQSTNPSGYLIELFNKCKTPNEVSCPPATRNHCRNISTN